VSVSHWSAYQSEINFRDPKMFIPERWLGDPRYDGDAKEVLQPFSIGPRNCLGKKRVFMSPKPRIENQSLTLVRLQSRLC